MIRTAMTERNRTKESKKKKKYAILFLIDSFLFWYSYFICEQSALTDEELFNLFYFFQVTLWSRPLWRVSDCFTTVFDFPFWHILQFNEFCFYLDWIFIRYFQNNHSQTGWFDKSLDNFNVIKTPLLWWMYLKWFHSILLTYLGQLDPYIDKVINSLICKYWLKIWRLQRVSQIINYNCIYKW